MDTLCKSVSAEFARQADMTPLPESPQGPGPVATRCVPRSTN